MTELLSPAGSQEALRAAVQCGADAVYMGFGAFNARRNAQNFTDEAFAAAVDYCHLRGVKVYLTLNTLLTDRELPDGAQALRRAAEIGVDAVLVQDWGVLALCRAVAPQLPLHASTQMSLYTLGGANMAAQLGMERVVLARELCREEIAEICRGCDAQVEIFAHGALCMCYSGQCAMSALIGQRSGNRGTCAQPCRMAYGVSENCAGAHPLSLKDANLSAAVQDAAALGVACLKLEGRMKRPEYVAVVTSVYRRLLDEHRAPTAEEQQMLADAFSRDGFTDGYYRGKKGAAMFGVRPENAPEPKALFAWARALYEKDSRRTVGITMTAAVQRDTPAALTLSDGVHTVTVCGDVPEAARARALTAQEVSERLCKLGGTAFSCAGADVSLEEGLMLSAAALNGLRRRGLDALAAARTARAAPAVFAAPPLPAPPEDFGAPLRLSCSIARTDQLTDALADCRPEMIYVPAELLDELDLARYTDRTRFCAVLPRVYRTADEAKLRAMLQETPELSAVALGNLGHFPIAEGLALEKRGDFGLNVFNSRALLFLKELGLASATVSFELRHQQVRALQKYLPCEAIVYGRLPLMITENCPLRCAGQCGSCQRGGYLCDRTGARFPVLRTYGCRPEIQNSRTLFLADKPEYRTAGLAVGRLRFTTETAEECVLAMRRYLGENDWAPADVTRGLFYRGVE